MKKIQKEYERKIKINHNNDVFTTFKRSSHPDHHSPNFHQQQKTISAHQAQHQNIESLKSTLKSLVPVSMDLNRPFSKSGILISNELKDSNKNDDYMLKLDNLTKHLQQIASKCHFSPGHPDSSIRERAFSSKDVRSKISYQNSQAISRYEPIVQQYVFKYSNNASMELPSRNRSFIDKESTILNHSNSKSKKKQEGSTNHIKHSYNYDKSQEQSSKKKSYSKNQVVVDMLQNPNNSKNLTKIFESYDNSYPELFKRRDRSESKQLQHQILFSQKAHRHRITSIVLSDHIYTSSLDYTIRRIYEQEGIYRSQIVQKYRGGIEHIASINNTIFGCGRDGYIRSIDGKYFYRCDSNPVSISESDRLNLVHLTLKNRQLRLFDLDKRITVSSLHFETEFTPLLKNTKQMFVASSHALFGVDWRKKDYLISLYKDSSKDQCHWLSDPYSNTFWLQSNRQLTILSPQFRKTKTKWLPERSQFVTYHCNRKYLNILVSKDESYHLMRLGQGLECQEVDSENSISRIGLMSVRQKQVIYGGKEGNLIIKQLKR